MLPQTLFLEYTKYSHEDSSTRPPTTKQPTQNMNWKVFTGDRSLTETAHSGHFSHLQCLQQMHCSTGTPNSDSGLVSSHRKLYYS